MPRSIKNRRKNFYFGVFKLKYLVLMIFFLLLADIESGPLNIMSFTVVLTLGVIIEIASNRQKSSENKLKVGRKKTQSIVSKYRRKY